MQRVARPAEELEATPHHAGGVGEPTGIRALVVEDEPKVADALRRGLQNEGFDVTLAHSVESALPRLESGSFDVILLDLMLPDISGLMLCRILNQHPSTRDVPIFILSALDPSWFESAQQARFVRFFQKPVGMKTLAESIIAVCCPKPKDSAKSAPRPESTQPEPNGVAHSHATANSSGAHPHSGHRGKTQ